VAGIDERDVAYISGNENDPGDPRGQDWLTIHPDDTFRLENRLRGSLRAWHGTLAPGTHAGLVRDLAAAGFPEVPRHPVPGGSAIRELHHGGRSALAAWHAGPDLPGYGAVFAGLDAIVDAAAEGEAHDPVRSVTPDDAGVG
jgi:hypothetical protein